MMKVFNSRRRRIMTVMILLAGGVVFEEWHRAGTMAHHHPATKLTDTADEAGTEFLLTNSDYAAGINLWLNPAVRRRDTEISYANFVFQSELHILPEDFDRLATRGEGGKSYPLPLTMAGKDINYSLFSVGHFKASLNLTPVKAKPADLIPTQIKPGLGGSLDF